MIKPPRTLSVAVVLGLLGLLGAVSLGCAAPTPSSITLTAADAGRTVDLRPGDRLTVALEGNLTTGFTWEVITANADILRTTGQPVFQADSKMIGSGGTISLTFEAAGRGQTPLRLAYRRSFEPGAPPLRTFEVTVTVR